MTSRIPPRSALTYLAEGHTRAALAVIALYLLRARWLYWPVSIALALLIYLYALHPALKLIFP